MPAGLLREVRPRPLRPEQVGRLVGAPEVARRGDLRIEEVKALAHVLRPRITRVADVAAVRGEEVAAVPGLARERRPITRGRRAKGGIGRQAEDGADGKDGS